MVRQRAKNHIQRGLLRRVFLRQSLIGYTGIVPKYVKKGGFLPGRSQTQATASPEKFVGYFQNASFIVTSSFHGTAFAISYQKPFYSIMKGNTLDSRQLSLLTDLDLQERFINKESNPKYSEIDYSIVTQKWRTMQNKSRDFLKQSILNI